MRLYKKQSEIVRGVGVNMLKLAVHLHLHYIVMWPEMKSYLANIKDYPYDLFVTLTVENSEIEKDIKLFKPDAKIWIVENRGYDVGPFIEFLHYIDLCKYDLIMKLHTKNKFDGTDTHINQYIFSRKLWFKTLLSSLIGNHHIFMNNIHKFEKYPKIGMLGSKYLITSNAMSSENMRKQVEDALTELGYDKASIKFVAGTMFICRSGILSPIKNAYKIKDFLPTDGNVKDGTLAHVLERVFGSLVIANGYQIGCINHYYSMQLKLTGNNLCRFIYQNKITNNHNRIIKICKLPIYHRRVL